MFSHRYVLTLLLLAGLAGTLGTSVALTVALSSKDNADATYGRGSSKAWHGSFEVKPGRLEFASPVRQKNGTYKPLKPWKCGGQEARLQPSDPIGWVGRLSHTIQIRQLRFRILLLQLGHPVQVLFVGAARLPSHGRAVHGLLTSNAVDKLGLMGGDYRLQYFSGARVLAEGDFSIRKAPIFYGY